MAISSEIKGEFLELLQEDKVEGRFRKDLVGKVHLELTVSVNSDDGGFQYKVELFIKSVLSASTGLFNTKYFKNLLWAIKLFLDMDNEEFGDEATWTRIFSEASIGSSYWYSK